MKILDSIELFFNAYCTAGMKAVYREGVPKEMMQSGIDKDGWYEWKRMPGTFTNADYDKLAAEFNVVLPQNFIEWHKRYFFEDGDCAIIRLPASLPTKPLHEIQKQLNNPLVEQLISMGLVPFADEGNDAGPMVFDTRNQTKREDFPIRVCELDYGGDLQGLSGIIFSSFHKMLACLTHFLNETKTRKSFEVLSDFYTIDPEGAGSSGKPYWEAWIKMEKANFEEFGSG